MRNLRSGLTLQRQIYRKGISYNFYLAKQDNDAEPARCQCAAGVGKIPFLLGYAVHSGNNTGRALFFLRRVLDRPSDAETAPPRQGDPVCSKLGTHTNMSGPGES